MPWIIDQEGETFEDASDVAVFCYDDEYFTEEDFDDHLNEEYEEYCILGHGFTPANILYQCDESAYRAERDEWIENRLTETRDEAVRTLERMRDGDTVDFAGYDVRFSEEDEDEEEECPEEKALPVEKPDPFNAWNEIYQI